MSDLLLIPVSAAAGQEQVVKLIGANDLNTEHQLDVIANEDWHIAIDRL